MIISFGFWILFQFEGLTKLGSMYQLLEMEPPPGVLMLTEPSVFSVRIKLLYCNAAISIFLSAFNPLYNGIPEPFEMPLITG